LLGKMGKGGEGVLVERHNLQLSQGGGGYKRKFVFLKEKNGKKEEKCNIKYSVSGGNTVHNFSKKKRGRGAASGETALAENARGQKICLFSPFLMGKRGKDRK